MFKRLRNKFLLLNLVIISIMMLIAFASIYFITYKNVRRDIDLELRRMSEFTRKPNESPDQARPGFDAVQAPPERSVAFVLFTDSQGNITSVSSLFTMDDTFYESAKNTALSRNADTGNFKLEGNYWTFMAKPYFDGYRIVFMDITSQQGILTSLIFTFLAVALATLIFIFFISRFFANRSIQPVKEAFDKQKQFIADASHELKTPLSVIHTNVDVLLSNGEDSVNNQAKWLYYIKSEAERMSKLTNDLLYLTQMDDSERRMIFAEFNLSEVVENALLTMEAVIFEHSISLDYAIEPGQTVYGSSEQIQQVVMILLDNAVKYTSSRGIINISLKRLHGSSVLSVANTGEGIPEEHIDKIFDRFYRTDKSRSRKSGGYGLGLAIAKAIIEQHGGRISVKSVLQGSTTFTVELPRSSRGI